MYFGTRVLNMEKDRIPDDAVLIDRTTKWGNPFRIGKDGTRVQVIQKYENWIKNQPELLADLHELKGHSLVCHCSPKICHGNILVDLVAKRC